MIHWEQPEHMTDAELLAAWAKLEPGKELSWRQMLSAEIERRGLAI